MMYSKIVKEGDGKRWRKIAYQAGSDKCYQKSYSNREDQVKIKSGLAVLDFMADYTSSGYFGKDF